MLRLDIDNRRFVAAWGRLERGERKWSDMKLGVLGFWDEWVEQVFACIPLVILDESDAYTRSQAAYKLADVVATVPGDELARSPEHLARECDAAWRAAHDLYVALPWAAARISLQRKEHERWRRQVFISREGHWALGPKVRRSVASSESAAQIALDRLSRGGTDAFGPYRAPLIAPGRRLLYRYEAPIPRGDGTFRLSWSPVKSGQ